VANSGTVPMLGWMARWTLPSGQTIDGLWTGTLTQMAENADRNGSLAAGASRPGCHQTSCGPAFRACLSSSTNAAAPLSATRPNAVNGLRQGGSIRTTAHSTAAATSKGVTTIPAPR
jgi:hypothetical protein